MKRLKNVLSFALMVAVLFSFSVPAFAASHTSGTPTLTVEEYITFLQEESPEDLDKFLALSSVEQQEFIDLLLDPATYTISDNPKISRSYNYVSQEANSNSQMALARATTWNAWGTQEVEIFGIAILKYRIEVSYNVSNNKITSINNNDAYVVRNLNPLVQTNTSSSNAWINSTRSLVYATGTFYYKLGPINNMSVQIGNVHDQLTGNASGDTSISYWRD